MTTLYKLTDADGQTRGHTQWGVNVTHTATGNGTNLCSADFIHAYENPLLAMIFNSIHCGFKPPRLWLATGIIGKRDGQIKCGCRELTTLEEIPLPVISTDQYTAFAIHAALRVYKRKSFTTWAKAWLSGKDRTAYAAVAANGAVAAVAFDVTYAASSAYAAAYAASTAASHAASAASAAAIAANSANAANAVAAAVANAGAAAANAASDAVADEIDFVSMMNKIMREKI